MADTDKNTNTDEKQNKTDFGERAVHDMNDQMSIGVSDQSAAPNIMLSSSMTIPSVHPQDIARSLDNLWTTVICLWVLQSSIVWAVTVHPEAAQLHDTQRKTWTFLITLPAMGRLLLVPLLFFISGFQLRRDLMTNQPGVVYLKRTLYALGSAVSLQGFKYFVDQVSSLRTVSDDDTHLIPYYATTEGIHALFNGPTLCVIALLALDYTVPVILTMNRMLCGFKFSAMTDEARYYAIVYCVLCPVILWQQGVLGLIGVSWVPDSVQIWINNTNCAELHFPIIYIIAYYAGTTLHYYIELIVKKHRNTRGRGILLVLISFFLQHTALSAYFPNIIPFTFDLRSRPSIILRSRNLNDEDDLLIAHFAYSFWTFASLLVIPECILAAVLYKPFFARRSPRWFSKYSYIYVVSFLVSVFSTRFNETFDNVFIQGIFRGLISLTSGIGWIIILSVISKMVSKLSSAMRSRGSIVEESSV